RTYCSLECRTKWEENHPILYQHVCYYCGREFESRAKNASFCCHKCYIRDRFWRKEDAAEVAECLEKGMPIPNAPGWIKDLVMGREPRQSKLNSMK
ncbi:MAG: hypothetical protein KAH05_09225, partial [Clostridiales bacterium]|nr:hypothetical protein [Clostridiales bacterium]